MIQSREQPVIRRTTCVVTCSVQNVLCSSRRRGQGRVLWIRKLGGGLAKVSQWTDIRGGWVGFLQRDRGWGTRESRQEVFWVGSWGRSSRMCMRPEDTGHKAECRTLPPTGPPCEANVKPPPLACCFPALPVHWVNATLLTLIHDLSWSGPSQPFLPCRPWLHRRSPLPQQIGGQLYPLSPQVGVSFHTLIFSCSANSNQMIISRGVGFKHGKRKFLHRKHCDDSVCYSSREFPARACHHFPSPGEQGVMLQCLQTLSWTPSFPSLSVWV